MKSHGYGGGAWFATAHRFPQSNVRSTLWGPRRARETTDAEPRP
jgi:hypothetical protein